MCSIWIGFFIANLTYYIARIEVTVTCSCYNNVHLVSYLCACFIKPCGATIGAIPVFYITVVCTVSCFCINMYDCVSCIWIAFFIANHTNLIARIGVFVSKSRNSLYRCCFTAVASESTSAIRSASRSCYSFLKYCEVMLSVEIFRNTPSLNFPKEHLVIPFVNNSYFN